MNGPVLCIGPDGVFGEAFRLALGDAADGCVLASTPEEAVVALAGCLPSFVVMDIEPLAQTGSEPVGWCQRAFPGRPVVLLGAREQAAALLASLRRGALDCFLKPAHAEEVAERCRAALRTTAVTREAPQPASWPADGNHLILGQTPAMVAVRTLIERVSSSTSTVLVTGESGTGKELAAHAIHRTSPVRAGPFVPINCAAIAPTLLESELFGHVKGAFTGAHADRAGYFEAARGGTLFLDEVSELPVQLQPKILRAIQEREIVRVGGTKAIPVQVRLIAASNRDLRHECREGRFREDLYFRLNVVDLRMPSLREHRDDIPLLVERTMQVYGRRLDREVREIDPLAMDCLKRYPWPGNIRELENAIERAIVVAQAGRLTVGDLPREVREALEDPSQGDRLRHAILECERTHILRVLEECEGNREETARRLGINPSTLYRKMAKLDLHELARATRTS